MNTLCLTSAKERRKKDCLSALSALDAASEDVWRELVVHARPESRSMDVMLKKKEEAKQPFIRLERSYKAACLGCNR